ncbi:glycosyltransferase family 21 protein [Exidia glandulosa HHB12029]|uniref:Ceramide glucosyltransferase n=1 Tax=Exidia glandulosa HHB12029 TaxID=1314781 RepID=A0A165BT93_EXIGL|nr:glycosyltransferase family 21 protein [Exidia glandulosa HHB12029]
MSLSPSRYAPLMLTTVLLVWYAILWLISLTGWRAARRRYSSRPRSPLSSSAADSVPGVSILRPLKGLDPNLYENLECTFTQEYPKYEIIMSVADAHDQALRVANDLIAKYPHVSARVNIGEEVVGVNPKINNLMPAYNQAAYDILWVLDSNVTVASGTLGRAVDALQGAGADAGKKRISLVHHVPFATAAGSELGARLEEAFINTNHARMYIALNTLAIDSCVMGKSNIYRRSDLEQVVGGLKIPAAPGDPSPRGLRAFGKYLAEDNMIAGALWHELDTRHDLSCDVAYNAIGNMDLAAYCWRRIRWIRVRKQMVMAATLLEPMTESAVVGSLVALALYSVFSVPLWLFFPLHMLAWLIVDLDVYNSLAGHPVPEGQRFRFVVAWLLREFLALPIWAYAVFGSQVTWRGRQYEVLKNGEVRLADAHSGGISSWFKGRRGYQHLNTDG